MKILYLHGRGSTPGGVKPTFLKSLGHEIINPALPDEDFAESVRIAQQAYDESRPNLIVASSRGGAVAMTMASGATPLILIAPAWKKWAPVTEVKPGTTILHSAHDEVIPIADSRELLRSSGLPDSALIEVGDDHLMTDEAAFQALRDAVAAVDRAGRER